MLEPVHTQSKLSVLAFTKSFTLPYFCKTCDLNKIAALNFALLLIICFSYQHFYSLHPLLKVTLNICEGILSSVLNPPLKPALSQTTHLPSFVLATGKAFFTQLPQFHFKFGICAFMLGQLTSYPSLI